jgi:hypothetical protein
VGMMYDVDFSDFVCHLLFSPFYARMLTIVLAVMPYHSFINDLFLKLFQPGENKEVSISKSAEHKESFHQAQDVEDHQFEEEDDDDLELIKSAFS